MYCDNYSMAITQMGVIKKKKKSSFREKRWIYVKSVRQSLRRPWPNAASVLYVRFNTCVIDLFKALWAAFPVMKGPYINVLLSLPAPVLSAAVLKYDLDYFHFPHSSPPPPVSFSFTGRPLFSHKAYSSGDAEGRRRRRK